MQATMPPQTSGGAGYERPTVRQFTVFLESRVGKLMKLLNALGEAGLRVNALAVEESADAALVRVIVSDSDDCRKCMREEQFSFSETDVLAVEVPPDDRHPLISVCTALLGAEINIHHAYPLLRSREKPAMALYVDDPTLAARVLMRRNFTILGESDLK